MLKIENSLIFWFFTLNTHLTSGKISTQENICKQFMEQFSSYIFRFVCFRATILSVSFKRPRNSDIENMAVNEEEQFWDVSLFQHVNLSEEINISKVFSWRQEVLSTYIVNFSYLSDWEKIYIAHYKTKLRCSWYIFPTFQTYSFQ